MYNLKGKSAIITGSGRQHGIGKSIAERLALEGCDIVISDLGTPKGDQFSSDHVGTTLEMESIAEQLRENFGVKVIAVPCDVRNEHEVKNLMNKCLTSFGQIDILVNNAGVGYIMEEFAEFKSKSWDAVLEVNLRGAFLCSREAAKAMIKLNTKGVIINIASQAAKSGFPFAAAYTSSKHGMIGLTRSNAVELGKNGIRVNAVCPNHITTGLGHWQNQFFSKKSGLDYESYLQGIVDRNPMGRTGRVEDISNAVAFLVSDQASYITGEALNVSGGEEYH